MLEGFVAANTRGEKGKQKSRQTKQTPAVSYLGTIFCVACLSKSPSFPAIAQCWLSVAPACRERSKRSRSVVWWCWWWQDFGEGGERGYGTSTWGWARTVEDDDHSSARTDAGGRGFVVGDGGGRRMKKEEEQ